VRLFYDFLMEEGLRDSNPVGRGRFTPGRRQRGPQRGLVPRLTKLPWIPAEAPWPDILDVAKSEPIRNRVMLALAYDAALRREELCSLRTEDLDPAHRTLRIRAETTKNRLERVVPYSASTGVLLSGYVSPLGHRRDRGVEARPRLARRRPQRIPAAETGLDFQQMIQPQTDELLLMRGQITRRCRLASLPRRGRAVHAGGLAAVRMVQQKPETDRHPLPASGHQHHSPELGLGPLDRPFRPVQHQHQHRTRRDVQPRRHRLPPILRVAAPTRV
jgi:hypothetical protein